MAKKKVTRKRNQLKSQGVAFAFYGTDEGICLSDNPPEIREVTVTVGGKVTSRDVELYSSGDQINICDSGAKRLFGRPLKDGEVLKLNFTVEPMQVSSK